LCHLDADDELEPGYLEAMVQAQESITTAVDSLLIPSVRRIHPGENPRLKGGAIPNRGKWPRWNECVIGTLVKRSMFQAVGGFRDHADDGTPLVMYEDWDLWLRCWNSGAHLVYVEDAVYREHVNLAGRNTNTHLSQTVYDAIWADHVRDREVLGRPVLPS
jgi:GT2 family glycosyltransferase